MHEKCSCKIRNVCYDKDIKSMEDAILIHFSFFHFSVATFRRKLLTNGFDHSEHENCSRHEKVKQTIFSNT